jgi:hypothetical protein
MHEIDSADYNSSPTSTDWNRRTLNLFLYSIFIATLLPMLLIGGLGHLHLNVGSINSLGGLLVAVAGPGHVGLTSFFYADPQMRSFFRQNPTRYIRLPIFCAIASGIVWQTVPEIYTANFLLCFLIWQTYHYQRQNYGILCFLNASTGSKVPITRLERTIVELSALAGILGMFKVSQIFSTTLVAPYMGYLYQIGLQILCGVGVLVIVAIATIPAIRRSKLRLGFLVICAVFYLPTFIVNDPGAAIASYAYAHGIQYYVFMYFVAASHRQHINDNRIILLVCAALTGITILTIMSDRPLWGDFSKFVFGMYLSLVMTHFMVDAGIWRLRGAFQRTYMKKSFSFIFQPRSTAYEVTGESPQPNQPSN